MAIKAYLDLVTSQHKLQPKFTAWLSSALSLVDDGRQVANAMPESFDVDAAEGVQLDTLGTVVGVSRELSFQPADGSPILDDENYRLVLKAKIAQNQWDGTIPQIYEVWSSLFPNISLNVVDNQNMTMSALVDGQLSPVATELVAGGYIIPKPAGVGLTIIEVTSIAEANYLGVIVSEMDSITVSTNIP